MGLVSDRLTFFGTGLAAAALASMGVAQAAGRQPAFYPPVPAYHTFFSLEGGAECLFGDQDQIASGEQVLNLGAPGNSSSPPMASSKLGGSGCDGWTGRLGFGQEHVVIFGGLFDSWAVYGRHTEFGSTNLKAAGDIYQKSLPASGPPLNFGAGLSSFQNVYTGTTESRRTVVDLEAGKRLGVGTGISVTMGARYARFEEKAKLNGDLLWTPPGVATFSVNSFDAKATNTFEGFGPRIGLTSKARLGGGFGLMISGSASALYGDRESVMQATHGDPTVTSASTKSTSVWVYNVEGEGALTLVTSIPGEFAIGARAEAWFGEAIGNATGSSCTPNNGQNTGCTRTSGSDHFNWGPFARWKLYFD